MDDSDISKPYGKTFEALGVVRDASKPEPNIGKVVGVVFEINDGLFVRILTSAPRPAYTWSPKDRITRRKQHDYL